MDFVTQIGGKYHPNNKLLFALKDKLMPLGIEVTHPISQDFVSDTANGFDPAVFSSYNVGLDYYESIAESNFHIVCNSFEDNDGYVGESAAREILYAMLKNRPIILLFNPNLKPSIDHLTRDIITRHQSQLHVANLLAMDDQEIESYLDKVAASQPAYDLSSHEKTLIRSRVRTYFRESIPAIEVV